MTDLMPTKQEKCQGAMLATAIGDALGWPNELRASNTKKSSNINDMFVSWAKTNRRPYWHQDFILPGEYSDDTQITLAVARSILTENWENSLTRYELPFWLSYQRGGGKALLKAATACKERKVLWKGKNPQDYFSAGGNGVAMRILPHVIGRIHSDSITELMTEVVRDGIITHGHPRALLGATCFAYALNYLLRKTEVLKYGEIVSVVINGHTIWGNFPDCNQLDEWKNIAIEKSGFDYVRTWNETVDHMVKQLKFIQDSLNRGLMLDDRKVLTDLECFSKANGAGDVAVLSSIFLASKYANNPVLGIKVPAFSSGMDTDTIASMTGAMLGMLCGTSWIPHEWRMVQDYDCILQMTELLMSDKKLETSKSYISQVVNGTDNWNKTPMGLVHQIASYTIPSKSAVISVKKLQTAFGQTLYIKNYAPIQQEVRGILPKEQLIFEDAKTPIKKDKAFYLNLEAVNQLKQNQKLNKKTCGKIFQIMAALLISQETSEEIARKFQVDLELVDLIYKFMLH